MDKEIIKAMATKFSEIFAISMLKKHRKLCRRGWLESFGCHTHFSKIVQILMGHPVNGNCDFQTYLLFLYTSHIFTLLSIPADKIKWPDLGNHRMQATALLCPFHS